MNLNKIRNLLFLHAVLFIYSLISVMSKAVSEWTSVQLFAGYGFVLLLLFVYAVLWQMVLKKQSLSIAFANKSVVVIWGIVWGSLFYKESVSWQKVVGAVIIMLGIICVVSENEQ